jgi:hypothetical protein
MTPAQFAAETATAQLVQLTAQYRASQPPADRPLTQEEIEQRLAALKTAYDQQNKPEPDPVIGTPPPQPFETTTWPRMTTTAKLDLAARLDDLGVPADGVKAILDGKAYSKADVQMAKDWKREALANPDLRARILSGDREAVRTLVGMSHLIATEADAK